MINKLSLSIKLSAAFLLIAALVGGVGYYQLWSLGRTDVLFLNLIDNDFVRRDILDEIKITGTQIENSTLRYAQGFTTYNAANEKEEIAAYKKTLDGYVKEYKGHFLQTSQDEAHQTAVVTLGSGSQAITDAANSFIEAHNTKSPAQLTVARQKLEKANDQFNRSVDELISVEDAQIKQEDAEVDTAISQLRRITFLLMWTVIVVAVLLGLIIANILTRTLKRLKVEAIRIANGDFSRQVPIHSGDEIGQLAGAFNSMTLRLRDSYRRLRVETERDRILLESLGEGVIAIDEKTNIALINESAIQTLGLTNREKLIGLPVNHVFTLLDEHEKPLLGSQTPTVAALANMQPTHGVFTFVRKDRGKIKLDIGANPIVVESRLTGAIMNLRDVTKEKEVDRMKTEFISLASHQLRTPLSAIKWFDEMLLSGDAGELKPDQAEFARNIADSTERMIALVNALLNISRIESGRIMVDPKPTDLRELVAGIVNDLKAKTQDKQQTLIISVHEDLPKINLDPRLIGQVYLNLLTNAIKYTPKGGEISVFISRKGDQIISQIADNGYGIPKEQQARVFQKFFRATNAVKVETDGTGLGLYLIKAIIESSGGAIWFKSEEGRGTTFWFSIPVSGMKPREGEVTLDN